MTAVRVCIAGIHRSGTSMVVARLLYDCGLYPGAEVDLIAPSFANADEYWEHRRFVEHNEGALKHFGGAWNVVPAVPSADSESWAGDEYLAQLRESGRQLPSLVEAGPLADWKDPPNSITLPFCLGLAPNLKVIVCVRNPLEVAASLQHLNAAPSTDATLELWKAYNERLIPTAPYEQRIITHADAYFARPWRELRRVLSFVGIDAGEDAVRRALSAIQCELRHSWFSTGDLHDSTVDRELIDLYAQLCVEAGWDDERTAWLVGADAPGSGGEPGTADVKVLHALVGGE